MNIQTAQTGLDPLYWREEAVTVPAEALSVPTMLSTEESRLLYWLACERVPRNGTVVDLGCFAGGSTARLAAGLAESEGTVEAFDFFRVSDPQKERYLYPAGVATFEGRDMLPVVRSFLSPWADHIRLHQGDVCAQRWTGGEISILVIDVAKKPHIADHIAQTFFPYLAPGRSIIVHQDYQHWRQPWIAAQMEMMADRIACVGWCAENTVLFMPNAPLDPAWLAERRTTDLDDATMTGILHDAMRRLDHPNVRRSTARAIVAIEDNPGVRRPWEFQKGARVGARTRTLVGEAGSE